MRTPDLLSRALAVLALGSLGTFLSTSPLHGQGLMERSSPAIGVAVGTSGIGFEIGVTPWEQLGFRLGLGWIPYEFDIDEDDATGTVSPPSPITRVTVDFFPFRGTFHLSAGLHRFPGGISLQAVPLEDFDLGDGNYSAAEIGRVEGRVWGRETAPYLGLGWQKRSGRVQPFLELGAALTGSPSISVTVSGPARNNPTFQADLDKEIREAEDDISSVVAYPHLSFGLRVRLGS
jgi:hypothetical protein